LHLVLHLLQARFALQDGNLDPGLRADLLRAIDLAGHQGAAAALAGGLRQLLEAGLNWQDLLPFLEAVENNNARKNAALRNAALSASRWLDAENIEHVFLKGAAFILEDNGDAAWRSTTDLDILVSPEDVAHAGEVLRTNGYRFAMDPSAYRPHLHHHYAPLVNDDTGALVELHIRLMQDLADTLVPGTDIFSGKQFLICKGQKVNVPCPEHRMIHLIAHAQISNWGYPLRKVMLKDLVDAGELARQHQVDWDQVRTAFTAIGAKAQLAGFLAAADITLGMKTSLEASQSRAALAWASTSIKSITQSEHSAVTAARILGHYLRVFARNPGRLNIVWETIKDPVRLQHLLKINRQRTG
jgi:hypothetical protein